MLPCPRCAGAKLRRLTTRETALILPKLQEWHITREAHPYIAFCPDCGWWESLIQMASATYYNEIKDALAPTYYTDKD
jgi:hypothetical protein